MRKRFTPWLKKDTVENIELVKQYYGYNHSKAVAALRILTNSELDSIKKILIKVACKMNDIEVTGNHLTW